MVYQTQVPDWHDFGRNTHVYFFEAPRHAGHGPMVREVADFEPHLNATLFAQGTELEAIAVGDLEFSITSAQELAPVFPELSIFTAGYVHQDAAHQVAVFNDPLMDAFKQKAEDELSWASSFWP